jgi:hypothetical protein
MDRLCRGTAPPPPPADGGAADRLDDVEGRIEIGAVNGHFSVFRLPV